MSKDKLGKDELLKYFNLLEGNFERLEMFYPQAGEQIRQMIENQPKKDYTKCSMGKIAEEFNVPYSLVHALERRINEDIQPEMDEIILDDWAKEMADILWDKTKYSDRINFLRKRGKKLLAEAGVKIVGGKE